MIGRTLGHYRITRALGRGGMGVVYMAEQREPVRRKVALKIIKPGMDTREVIARFEAERQALAMMDHPNVATVLDAGITDIVDARGEWSDERLVAEIAPHVRYHWLGTHDNGGRQADEARAHPGNIGKPVIGDGEQHDDPITHTLEAATLEGIGRRRGNVILAMEMFERDVQESLDHFGMGHLPEADFLKASRPWPRYATDYKPLIVTMLAVADGVGIVTENLYPGRFRYVEELQRLGADIRADGHHAVVRGVPRLSGAPVRAHDIRAGAALVVAGLAADGVTTVAGVDHVDRGYDDFVGCLTALGAKVERLS